MLCPMLMRMTGVLMRLLLGFMVFLLSMPLYAVQVDGLYTANVAVKDQSSAARNMAMGEALREVVHKVSGRRSALDNVALLEALSNAGSYVEQFQYKQMDEGADYWLIVRFQKAGIDQTLQQFGVPVWGANRPSVLLWLAIDEGGRRSIAGAESDSGLTAILTQEVRNMGLHVTLPLLDLADQRDIGFNDVWGGFSEQIQQASKRYGHSQVMFGRLLKKGSTWQFDWTLMNEGQQNSGLEKSNTARLVFRQAFAQVAEKLADTYAPLSVASQENQLNIEVADVKSLSQFVNMTSYLSSLDMVKKLSWGQLIDNKVVLTVVIRGDAAVLEETIALNNALSPDSSPRNQYILPDGVKALPADLMEKTLYYRAN